MKFKCFSSFKLLTNDEWNGFSLLEKCKAALHDPIFLFIIIVVFILLIILFVKGWEIDVFQFDFWMAYLLYI